MITYGIFYVLRQITWPLPNPSVSYQKPTFFSFLWRAYEASTAYCSSQYGVPSEVNYWCHMKLITTTLIVTHYKIWCCLKQVITSLLLMHFKSQNQRFFGATPWYFLILNSENFNPLPSPLNITWCILKWLYQNYLI